MADFLDRLRTGPPIVADGGMGALLIGATPGLRCPEEANLRAPESVIAVHASYIRAGAELIETNTFGANRRKLAGKLLEDEFEAINSAGVRLAREARDVSGRDVLIAGAIGPLGELEAFDAGEHGPLYAEQARVLEGRGVDLFMIETFFDLDQLVAAVEAVRGVSSLPIVALLTFDDEAETVVASMQALRAGGSPSSMWLRSERTTAPARTLRCSRSTRCATPACRSPPCRTSALRASSAAASSIPTRRRSTSATSRPRPLPSARASWAVAAARRRRRSRRSGRRSTTSASPRAAFEARELDEEPLPIPAVGETRLARALREGEWVVSVELDPPKGGTNEAMIEVARVLRQSGAVGFVDVNDNPMARARMNALMASIAIQREAGIETIPHVTPRDTTVMGLEGVLLGAHADGVRNILAVTGDPPHVGDYPGSRGVYEIDSIGLVQLLAGLNQGVDYVGKAIDRPTSFFIGVAVNPTADDLDLELERFERKVASGAHFAMTQALFDLEGLELFLERLGGSWPIPLLAGVWPLRSHAMALRLHNEVPGISVPDHVLAALRDAGADAPAAGLALARELLESLRGRVAGVYVIPPFKQPEAALDLLL